MLRRPAFRRLGLAWLLLAAFQSVLVGQPGSARGHALQVGPVVMTVTDMNRSVDFYTHVLTFQKVKEINRSGAAPRRTLGDVFDAWPGLSPCAGNADKPVGT